MKVQRFVAEEQITEIESVMKKLNRRAVKLGVKEITLEYTGKEEIRRVKITRKIGDRVDQTGVNVKFIEIILTGESIKIAGWAFLAKIEHDTIGLNGKNIILNLSDRPLAKDYQDANPDCDHCKSNRRRVKTYIVENINTKEVLQVGSTCVKDFTGHPNAEKILNFYGALQTFFDINIDYEPGNEGSGNGWFYADTKDFVRVAAEIILKFGFVSKSNCNYDETPTSYDVLSSFLPFSKPTYGNLESTDKGQELFDRVFSEHLTSLKSKENPTDFDSNNILFLESESFSLQYAAYVTATVHWANKVMIDEREKKRTEGKTRSNEHIGEKKERIERKVTVVSKTNGESMYGTYVRYGLEDEKGNSLVWFYSGYNIELDENKVYNLKFTVKDHTEYKGRKQTMIQRGTPA